MKSEVRQMLGQFLRELNISTLDELDQKIGTENKHKLLNDLQDQLAKKI